MTWQIIQCSQGVFLLLAAISTRVLPRVLCSCHEQTSQRGQRRAVQSLCDSHVYLKRVSVPRESQASCCVASGHPHVLQRVHRKRDPSAEHSSCIEWRSR